MKIELIHVRVSSHHVLMLVRDATVSDGSETLSLKDV